MGLWIAAGLSAIGLMLAKKAKSNSIGVHPHGEHMCVCPECGQQVKVGTGYKCNTQYCPQCGTRMRAVETGEWR